MKDPPRPDPKLQMASHSATMNDRASDVEESDDDASVDDEDLKNTDCLYQLSHFWWCRPDENEDASAQAATWESMRDRHCGVCSCILVSESVVFELKPCGHHLCAQCYVLDFQGGFDHQKRLSPDKTPQYTSRARHFVLKSRLWRSRCIFRSYPRLQVPENESRSSSKSFITLFLMKLTI